ncbi:MAG: hypothetical protein OIF48_08255 [Silicimonas sp.]|nr:hypothetical protein [Silicimonas sp.]
MLNIIGCILGLVWAVAVVILPGFAPQPFIPINLALIYAVLPGGLVLAVMVPFGRDSTAVRDTALQMLLALLLWPFAITVLGSVTVIVMGIATALALLIHWLGARLWEPLATFGWWAAFGTTVFATLWSGWRLLT